MYSTKPLSFIKRCIHSKIVFHQRLSSLKWCLYAKVLFPQISSSFKAHLPSKLILPQGKDSLKVCFPSNFIFPQRMFPSKLVFLQKSSPLNGYGHLPSKDVIHRGTSSIGCLPQWLYSIKVYLTAKVVFHQRYSSIKRGRPQLKVFFLQSLSFNQW